MDHHPFFELLHSFAQLDVIQLERDQERLRHHQQRNRLHHVLAEQSTPPCCHREPVIYWRLFRGQQRYRCGTCIINK